MFLIFRPQNVVFLPDKSLSNTALPCRCPLYVPCFTKERGEPPQGCNEVPLCGTGRHGFAVRMSPTFSFCACQKENVPDTVQKKKRLGMNCPAERSTHPKRGADRYELPRKPGGLLQAAPIDVPRGTAYPHLIMLRIAVAQN